MNKGKTAVIPWPEVNIGEYREYIKIDEQSGQELTNSWGAQRRAFLSSCIEDREWMDKDEHGLFHGPVRKL
jgi:hypothetical protein